MEDPPHHQPRPVHPIVTSASEHEDENSSIDDHRGRSSSSDDDSDEEFGDESGNPQHRRRRVQFPEDLLDESLDGQDEAYVRRHLRPGGEPVASDSGMSGPPSREAPQVLPQDRHADAVLSCPRCFATVCRDCQRHERYADQYRAMFVSNVSVNWNETWVHDDVRQALVKTSSPDQQQCHPYYYTVTCANCGTQVAVLDMSDEVYHFTGCLASTS